MSISTAYVLATDANNAKYVPYVQRFGNTLNKEDETFLDSAQCTVCVGTFALGREPCETSHMLSEKQQFHTISRYPYRPKS